MSKKPIRIELTAPSDKLDPLSRLNYAKTYTVEHNVKVLFIGRVAGNYEQEVATAFNSVHPPLNSSSSNSAYYTIAVAGAAGATGLVLGAGAMAAYVGSALLP